MRLPVFVLPTVRFAGRPRSNSTCATSFCGSWTTRCRKLEQMRNQKADNTRQTNDSPFSACCPCCCVCCIYLLYHCLVGDCKTKGLLLACQDLIEKDAKRNPAIWGRWRSMFLLFVFKVFVAFLFSSGCKAQGLLLACQASKEHDLNRRFCTADLDSRYYNL